MRRIGVDQRRARLGLRHHLARGSRASDVVEVAADLVGLHSSDPASVYLAAMTRMRKPEIGGIETALYEVRSLVRIVGMRRTMFVVPVGLAPMIHAACTQALVAAERRRVIGLLEQAGIAKDGGRWLARVEKATLRALLARGEATAVQLSEEVPELRHQIRFGEGKKWEGSQGVSTRVLFLLATEGRILRCRPHGSWTSSQYRWATTEAWLGDGLASVPVEAARPGLLRKWLVTFGPGTIADLKWWTGWTAAQLYRTLTEVGAVEVDLDGTKGFVLADDLAPVRRPEPWAAFLPSLDPTVMGWSNRGWFLGQHRTALFDRNGNAGPTVWWDGQVVGGWAQRKDGEITFRLLEDVGGEGVEAVEAEAERLAKWLVAARVTPRFRTPLEQELTS